MTVAIEKKRIPPEALIVENGIGCDDYNKIAAQFCELGAGITGNMINAGLIKPEHSVLDVGCGLGRLARPLIEYLEKGSYVGLDTTKSSVEWCVDEYSDVPNFDFIFADVFSTNYNPESKVNASEYQFPLQDESFDFVWSTSLFTHLVFEDFDNYLSEMARVMKPGAKCWNTYLLLDSVAMELTDSLNAKNTRHKMPHAVHGGRVRDIDNRESQIALHENMVVAAHLKHGLEIEDIRYGPWSGRQYDVRAGGQDVIIAVKK